LPTDLLLQQRADAGDHAAQIALGRSHEADGRHDLARGWFARAAQGGDVEGLRRLAISLLTRPPLAIHDGMGMIRQAAERGDGEAAHLCAVLAAQDRQLPSNLDVARDYLERAARRGYAPAQAQIALLARNGALDLEAWLAHPPLETAHDAPRIRIARGFATPEECDWLIARARARLGPARVYAPGGTSMRAEDQRDNRDASFNIAQSDIVLSLLRERMARATGFAADAMEPAMVLHYEAGQRFGAHYDFIDPDMWPDDIRRNGQRVATVLVYLDDGTEGGETEFVDLGWRHRGAKGDALIFDNVDGEGRPDRRTRHAGLAPTGGEKWLLSQWIRGR
jgi:prolyl 4-hydroxylase